jgi:hypothetical protein
MNTQVWQVPALAITAQAFLFTIMFSSETGQWPRVASAVLAMAASTMSIHVLVKHRFHQSQDFGRMLEIERELKLSKFAYANRAHDIAWRKDIDTLLPGKHRLQVRKLPFSSVTVWVYGLAFFALVAAATLVFALIMPDLFGQSPADLPVT